MLATDNTGGTQASDVVLNSQGYPEISSVVIIPHLFEEYKIALYATQAAADADTGAVWTIDDITTASVANTLSSVSSDDTTPGFLNGKLIVGTNVKFTENNGGANETLSITASPGLQSVTATVAASALTLGLNASTLDFRKTPLTDGTPSNIISAALSLVVPSGATLGTTNAVESRLILLAIDNGGTVELAVVYNRVANTLDETGLLTTIAIDANADSFDVFYSTTARTSVPYRVVGFVESTQATAGTWATSPTLIQGAGGNSLSSFLDFFSTTEIKITEQADHTNTPTAGFGYYWVKNEAPNAPQFTDDAGTDYGLISALQTELATTSGTAVTFTGIPAWVKKVTIMFADVSTTGTAAWRVRLGTVSSIEVTVYESRASEGTNNLSSTNSFLPLQAATAAATASGVMTIYLQNSSTNHWVYSSNLDMGANNVHVGAGDKALAGVLTRIEFSTTDVFDNGAVSIMWE